MRRFAMFSERPQRPMLCARADMGGVSHREAAGYRTYKQFGANYYLWGDGMTTSGRGASSTKPRHLFTLHSPISSRGRGGVLREAGLSDAERDRSFRRVVLSIPAGTVSTYGKVAAAAGYPLYHRAVARVLRMEPPDQLPWHRVVGAGGEIKLPQNGAEEQRARLEAEGVRFRGKRVDMDRFEHRFRAWEIVE